jgi:hypothetical protein
MFHARKVASLFAVAGATAALLSVQAAMGLGWTGLSRSQPIAGEHARQQHLPVALAATPRTSPARPAGAAADGIGLEVQVYFANAQGDLINVTAAYSYQEGHIYSVATGALYANVPDYQNGATSIYDLYGNWIGEIAYPAE